MAWLQANDFLVQWGLLAIAVIGAMVALAQWREALSLRREQAQPNVVAFMRFVPAADHQAVELCVRNYGRTPAYDISLQADPPLAAADEDFWVFDTLPMLAPEQEWATIWEIDPSERFAAELPLRHDVTVCYRDSAKRRFEMHSSLDWESMREASYVVRKDQHDIAEALVKIHKLLERTSRDLSHSAPKTSRQTAQRTVSAKRDDQTQERFMKRVAQRIRSISSRLTSKHP